MLACEDLVLRARADLDAGRIREAALQARVALESLLAEMPEMPGNRRPALEADREAVGEAANAALAATSSPPSQRLSRDAVVRMESALRARRLERYHTVTRSSPRGWQGTTYLPVRHPVEQATGKFGQWR